MVSRSPRMSADVDGGRHGCAHRARLTRSRDPTTMRSPRPRTRSASASGVRASASTMPATRAAFRRRPRATSGSTASISTRPIGLPSTLVDNPSASRSALSAQGYPFVGAERHRRPGAAPAGRQSRAPRSSPISTVSERSASRSTDRCRVALDAQPWLWPQWRRMSSFPTARQLEPHRKPDRPMAARARDRDHALLGDQQRL